MRQILGALLLRDQPGEDGVLESVPFGKDSLRVRKRDAGADHQKTRCLHKRGIPLQELHVCASQHFGAVPRAECADEADDGASFQAVACANIGAVDVRAIAIGINPVRIDEHTPVIDAKRDDFVHDRPADNDQQIGGADIQVFDAPRQGVAFQPPAPVVADPDFRPVVFEDKRQPQSRATFTPVKLLRLYR
jgi:hypothetical protein